MDQTENAAAVFTSGVFPPGKGLKGSKNIPLGLIVSPMAHVKDIPTLEEKDMNLCLTCGSYLNMYCDVDDISGEWKCSICKSLNFVTTSKSRLDPRVLQSDIVEYAQVGQEKLSIGPEANQEATMIVIDGNIAFDEVEAIMKSISSLSLENVGLIIFSSMIKVYQVGVDGIASSDVYSPFTKPEDMNTISKLRERQYFGSFDHLQYCISTYFRSGGKVTQKSMSRKEQLRRQREARQERVHEEHSAAFNGFDISETAKLLDSVKCQTNKRKNAKRCTLEAITYANLILHLQGFRAGRTLLFTNGCCNLGLGSVVSTNASVGSIDTMDVKATKAALAQMKHAGLESFQSGIGIDVFCTGSGFLGVQALLCLVQASSGYAFLHESYKEQTFQKNLEYICTKTKISRHGAVCDIRVEVGVEPKIVHSGGSIAKECIVPYPNEEKVMSIQRNLQRSASKPNQKIIRETLLRLNLNRYDPSASITLLLEKSRSSTVQSHLYFQFISRYVNGDVWITRVKTQRVQISADEKSFLESINPSVIAVLLAKEAAFRSMNSSPAEGGSDSNVMVDKFGWQKKCNEAKGDLMFTLQNILSTQGFKKTPFIELNNSFKELIKSLHHFQRGAILGDQGLLSLDERCVARDYFLRFGFEKSLLILQPQSWTFNSSNKALVPVHAGTLSLCIEATVALDTFDKLFIWNGSSTNDDKGDITANASLLHTFLDRGQTRFPSPQVIYLRKGETRSREMIARLVPSHGDTHEVQSSLYPHVGKDQLQKTRSEFQYSEHDPCVSHWYLLLRKSSGKSLCR